MTERGVFRLFRIFLIPSACHASATDFLSYLILYTITFSLLRFPFCVYFFFDFTLQHPIILKFKAYVQLTLTLCNQYMYIYIYLYSFSII